MLYSSHKNSLMFEKIFFSFYKKKEKRKKKEIVYLSELYNLFLTNYAAY